MWIRLQRQSLGAAIVLALPITGGTFQAEAGTPAPVGLRAADGVRVFGRHCEAGRPDAPPILPFHQA
jgi:hypothetical protein